MKWNTIYFLFSLVINLPAYASEKILCSQLFDIVDVASAIKELKQKPREGWVRRNIPNPETIWDHSLKVSKSANILFTRRDPTSRRHAALMGLFHDLAESKVPDYTPLDKISAETKEQQERQALLEILNTANRQQRNIFRSWEEYEANQSMTAILVKDLDKIDAAIQAMVYGLQGHDVHEFFPYTRNKIKDPELLEIYDRVYASYLSGNLSNPYGYYFDLLQKGP